MLKGISKFALPVVILAGLYLLVTGNLFSLNLLLIVQVIAMAAMPWARRSFQPGQFSIHADPKDGQMIASGPYYFVRHPMYASTLAIIWAGIAGHFSFINFGLGVIVTVVVFIRIMNEEQYLRAHYPDYIQYARRTKRIIPFLI